MSNRVDKKYLAWVRTQPSMVSSQTGDIVAHHVRIGNTGGTGLKPFDYMAVPLTAAEHNELHNVGESDFWDSWGIDPIASVGFLLTQYMIENGMTVNEFINFMATKMRQL